MFERLRQSSIDWPQDQTVQTNQSGWPLAVKGDGATAWLHKAREEV
jgi:hypothetical protein